MNWSGFRTLFARGPLQRRTVDSRLTFAYVLALLLFVATTAIALMSLQRVFEGQTWVDHTHGVIEHLDNAYASELLAESSQRAYVITGQSPFLQTYRTALIDAEGEILIATRQTKNDAGDASKWSELQRLVKAKNTEMQFVIDLRDTQGPQEAMRRIAGGSGIGLMASIRAEEKLIDEEEQHLLAARLETSRRSRIVANVTTSLSGLAGIGLLTGLFFLSARFVRTLAESEEATTRYNERLQEEVENTRRARRELERSNHDLQDFAFVASHDLQEPLRKIRSYGERIKLREAGKLEEISERDLGRMQNAAERLQSLINDILEFSRVTTKGLPFARVPLNQIFDEVFEDLESRIQDSGAKVTRNSLPAIQADPVQMRQLFQNLIANALKFRKPDEAPVVTVQCTATGPSGTRIEFRDNGIGFDEKHSEKIFTIFQRLHGRDKYEGSGVGLSICRKIVDRHGGSIEALGEPGRGATFVVTLPTFQKDIDEPNAKII